MQLLYFLSFKYSFFNQPYEDESVKARRHFSHTDVTNIPAVLHYFKKKTSHSTIKNNKFSIMQNCILSPYSRAQSVFTFLKIFLTTEDVEDQKFKICYTFCPSSLPSHLTRKCILNFAVNYLFLFNESNSLLGKSDKEIQYCLIYLYCVKAEIFLLITDSHYKYTLSCFKEIKQQKQKEG